MDFLESALQRSDRLEQDIAFIPTNLQAVDDLLKGGLYIGEVTELVGASASGKTQVCLAMAATFAATLGATVMYLDASNSFSPGRLQRMCYEYTDDEKQAALVMDNVRCISVKDMDCACQALSAVALGLAKQASPFYRSLRLLIFDSIPGAAQPVLGDRHSRGHAMLSQLGLMLRQLAQDFQMAVLTTNYLVSSFPSSSSSSSSSSASSSLSLKPALGLTWAGVADNRIHMRSIGSASASSSTSSSSRKGDLHHPSMQKVVLKLVKSCKTEIGDLQRVIVIDDRGVHDDDQPTRSS